MSLPLQLGRVRHESGVDVAVIGELAATLLPRFDGDMLALINEGATGLATARAARDSAQDGRASTPSVRNHAR